LLHFAARNRKTPAYRRRAYARNSSIAFSSFDSDNGKNGDGGDGVAVHPMIDPGTRALAVRAAEEKKEMLLKMMPDSLLLDREMMDCVAPFRREEVSALCTR